MKPGPRKQCGRVAEEDGGVTQRFGDAVMGLRVARVDVQRTFEVLDALAVAVGRALVPLESPAKVRVVGLEALCRTMLRDANVFVGRQSGLERDCNPFGNVTLDGKDIRQLAIERLRPDVRISRGINQLRDDAQPIRRASNAALDDVRDTELRRDLLRALVGFLIAHHRGARDHLEASDLRELGDDVLGDTVAEVLIVCAGAHVRQRQHGDRRLARCRRHPSVRFGRERRVECGEHLRRAGRPPRRIFLEAAHH